RITGYLNLHSNEIRLQVCHGFVTCVTNHANLDSALSCILALSYKSHQSWQYFVMHCSLRYKSHQSWQCFVMHLSSALQIGPILAVFCHALQLALQITPLPTALCYSSFPCLTNPANPDSPLSCIFALRYKSHQSRQRFVMHLSSALQIGPISTALCHTS